MKLQQQAEIMIEFARQHPWLSGQPVDPYRRELSRGLVLLYLIDNGINRLALSRAEVPPGELEETICRRAFAVPDWAERQERQKGIYHHVAFAWADAPPPEPVKPLATITYPANSPWLAVPHGCWQRNTDGSITVRYIDEESMRWSVLASAEMKQVLAQRAAPPSQATMFETKSENYYGE